jgi:tRNA-dihydrouridine synthase
MIGRASIGNPWIFREIKHFVNTGQLLDPPTLEERVNAAKQHLRHSIEWKGERIGVNEMKRHYTNYFRGFPNIKPFRSTLVSENEPEVLFATLDEIFTYYSNEENFQLALL